jgi:hypothetical protein
MGKFTFEELCLLRFFDTTDRETLRNGLAAGMIEVEAHAEPELLPLLETTLEKLDGLSDEEFAALVPILM